MDYKKIVQTLMSDDFSYEPLSDDKYTEPKVKILFIALLISIEVVCEKIRAP